MRSVVSKFLTWQFFQWCSHSLSLKNILTVRERQELHRNILSTSLLSLLIAFVPALLKCGNWSLLKCSGSVRAALPAASCYLLHCVAAWAALVWQLCCMTVLQCVFNICDFIAVKCRPKKKKRRQIFLSYCCNSLWTFRLVLVTTCSFF